MRIIKDRLGGERGGQSLIGYLINTLSANVLWETLNKHHLFLFDSLLFRGEAKFIFITLVRVYPLSPSRGSRVSSFRSREVQSCVMSTSSGHIGEVKM